MYLCKMRRLADPRRSTHALVHAWMSTHTRLGKVNDDKQRFYF